MTARPETITRAVLFGWKAEAGSDSASAKAVNDSATDPASSQSSQSHKSKSLRTMEKSVGVYLPTASRVHRPSDVPTTIPCNPIATTTLPVC